MLELAIHIQLAYLGDRGGKIREMERGGGRRSDVGQGTLLEDPLFPICKLPPTQKTRFFHTIFGKAWFSMVEKSFLVEGRHDTLRKRAGIWSPPQGRLRLNAQVGYTVETLFEGRNCMDPLLEQMAVAVKTVLGSHFGRR